MTRPAGARIVMMHKLRRDLMAMTAMCCIRTVRMAEAFARMGHRVDIPVQDTEVVERSPGVRHVPLAGLDWDAYDVVKAEFHAGFDRVARFRGADHPFLVVKFGSLVGPPGTPGVYFFGETWEALAATQRAIAERARYVTILTEPSADLWRSQYGTGIPVLMVPTGVDAVIPAPRTDPYAALGLSGRAVLFAGNIYTDQQREVNLVWQDRLNRLGRALQRRGLTLVAMGPGYTDRIDHDAVRHVGALPVEETWDWQRGAVAGVVLAHGPGQHNESSKIYSYLRTGLPVLCERPVPNASLVTATGCGAVVDLDDVEALAAAAEDLAIRRPRFDDVADWTAREHSWDERAARYAPVLAEAVTARRDRPPRRAVRSDGLPAADGDAA